MAQRAGVEQRIDRERTPTPTVACKALIQYELSPRCRIISMPMFDFIAGDDFRQSLEGDYRDLTGCVEAKAWKAVHVLAGSIIEAVLLDHLDAAGNQDRN